MDWYPRQPAKFDTGTLGWTLAERGAYSGLVDQYYANEGALPDDDAQLAALLRVGLDEWLKVAPRVRTKFEARDGKLHHEKCDEEIEKYQVRAEKSRENGKSGGRPKGSKAKAKRELNPAATGQAPTTDNKNEESSLRSDSSDVAAEYALIAAFERWWALYPRYRRGAKGHVLKKWLSIVRRKQATPEQLMAGLQRYVDAGYGDSTSACGAEVFLNQQRWTIERFAPPIDKEQRYGRSGSNQSNLSADDRRRQARADIVAGAGFGGHGDRDDRGPAGDVGGVDPGSDASHRGAA